ncbi:MAG: LemA family protein [Bacteroidetes bacterium RBG_13_46_8]|nr:MAG: LemA family protein [Bacteroidetes bacterium RBG_13_46_8]
MKKRTIVTIAVVVLLLLILGISCQNTYNKMVTLREQVNREWANVENQYQRRLDLIPNLVATVKGYAEHEQETFTRVVEARAKATQVKVDATSMTEADIQGFQAAQGELSSALSRLLLVVENYPELKANQNFLELQAQLEGTENRISVERKKFNDTATQYNTYIKSFPPVLFAGLFGFKATPYFDAEPQAEKAPKVEF